MTLTDSTKRQGATTKPAVTLYGLKGVIGATWSETAGVAQEKRYRALIKTVEQASDDPLPPCHASSHATFRQVPSGPQGSQDFPFIILKRALLYASPSDYDHINGLNKAVPVRAK